ncbi:glutathione S-transferase family protein [Salinivibrio kushneri]|uniref:glutathione S-transferase family protein n=1 Tax=Salinivibrio kushneri TaxID=1908198 RepID=UPI0022B2D72E|nr:glutathione S-transferase family protein [Salinivibrio kushneri]WBA17249.1 glutathione S-transferase family protein [Salinivibrio kushneri]
MRVLHGDSLSPHTRKIALALRLKHLDYQLAPTSPFEAHERIIHHPPMQTVVALAEASHTIYQDTVITAYLDDAYPDPLLYPGNPTHRAQIRWVEWFCRYQLDPLITDTLFYQRVVRGHILDKTVDHQAVNQALQTLPACCQYLGEQVKAMPTQTVTMAGISVWSLFRCAKMAGLVLDDRFAALNDYLSALDQHPLFDAYAQEENHQLTPFFASPISLATT